MTKRVLVQLASRALALNPTAVVDLFLYVHPRLFFLAFALRETYTNVRKSGISVQVLFYSCGVSCFHDHCDISRGHLDLQVRPDD